MPRLAFKKPSLDHSEPDVLLVHVVVVHLLACVVRVQRLSLLHPLLDFTDIVTASPPDHRVASDWIGFLTASVTTLEAGQQATPRLYTIRGREDGLF
jgi:hypothetical protein